MYQHDSKIVEKPQSVLRIMSNVKSAIDGQRIANLTLKNCENMRIDEMKQ